MSSRRLPNDGLRLHDFIQEKQQRRGENTIPTDVADFRLSSATMIPNTPLSTRAPSSFFIKTYGCQMNVNDSDIVRSVLQTAGLQEAPSESEAEVILTNTCAIREGAEQKVWQRLAELRSKRRNVPKRERSNIIVGVLGCMAKRLKEDLLKDGMADLVVGPDAYRDLPRLVETVWNCNIIKNPGPKVALPMEEAMNVQLSLDETYADITPVRKNPEDISAFVSIQRGCANRCSFCIVPFTRGQERSRPLNSILQEIRQLVEEQDVKEVVLLGQNVNSYHDTSDEALLARPSALYQMSSDGFASRIRRANGGYYFADLVEHVSNLSPELRVRFTSPHPKDYPSTLLDLMAERPNVCNQLHMPAQSGSTSMLRRMKRGYSREAYLDLVLNQVLTRIPDVALSSDFIAGFCGETEEEHRDTLSLMELVRYDQAFMFAYSMREKTHAHRTMQDDVPEETKQRRLAEIIQVFQRNVQDKNAKQEVGQYRLVLVEGPAKRTTENGTRQWHGRTDQNKRILFPVSDNGSSSNGYNNDDEEDVQKVFCATDEMLVSWLRHATQQQHGNDRCDTCGLLSGPQVALQKGDYAIVQVTEAKGHTLRGRALWRTTLQQFSELGWDKARLLLDQVLGVVRDQQEPSQPLPQCSSQTTHTSLVI